MGSEASEVFSTAQRLKPSQSHGRTGAELNFAEGRGRHLFCFFGHRVLIFAWDETANSLVFYQAGGARVWGLVNLACKIFDSSFLDLNSPDLP